ncbi:hypothetical protein OG777_08380 [Micromonospora peucetia]|uniref:hypothetical protein n=1 Tax=Micromonospora peucetia TaxID=47871 RepID=UPI0022501B86|nr:hypothetical protein [Micromonospora peucetia]MCX4386943.1 hypothetical protein [Micromonospora peucetia]
MNHYLVVFDRRAGKIVRSSEFSDAGRALDARFQAEVEYQANKDVEVVVLGAASWDALIKTHARYFQNVRELAASALRGLQKIECGPALAGASA